VENEIQEMLFTAASFKHTNVADIARAVGMTPSNLYRKIRLGTLRPAELIRIGDALGAEYSFYYTFPNGTKIGKLADKNKKI